MNDSSLQSHLATDIAATRDRLDTLDVGEHSSLGALSSLSEACAAVWHDLEFDMTGKGYFLFEDRATSWVEGKRDNSYHDKKAPAEIVCNSIHDHTESRSTLNEATTSTSTRVP